MSCESRVYSIRHQCLSKDPKFEIVNEYDQIEYIVRCRSLTFLDDMFICQSSNGEELIEIRKELNHFHLRYDISRITGNHSHLATVKRNSVEHHMKKRFEINSIYGVYHLEHRSEESNHQFQFKSGDEIVVDVSQSDHLSSEGKTCHVKICENPEKDLFFLAIVIALLCAQRWHQI